MSTKKIDQSPAEKYFLPCAEHTRVVATVGQVAYFRQFQPFDCADCREATRQNMIGTAYAEKESHKKWKDPFTPWWFEHRGSKVYLDCPIGYYVKHSNGCCNKAAYASWIKGCADWGNK
mgnify:CR=1 FL=1